MDHDHSTALTKIAIAGTGTAASILTLNEWLTVFTLVYVLMQIGLLVPKYLAWIKDWYAGKK